MGHIQSSGLGVLVLIERPLVPDIQADEEVIVEVNVNGQALRFSTWPSQPLWLPPPIEGEIFMTVYVAQKDVDEDEADLRPVGHLCMPAEACSFFHEPVFEVCMGLLTDQEMQKYQGASETQVMAAFTASWDVAKIPSRPKVSVMFAACEPGMERWSPEAMRDHLNQLQERPSMKLMLHSREIINELSLSESKAVQEVLCNHREFASKENLYQGFVQSARMQKVTLEERMRRMGLDFAKMLGAEMDGADTANVFFEWYKIAMGSRYTFAVMRLTSNKDRLKKLMKDHIGKYIMYAKLCWDYWKKMFVYEELKGACEIQFVVRGVDYDKLVAHTSVAEEFGDAVSEVCAAECRQMFMPDDMISHFTRVGSPTVSVGDTVTSLFDFDFLEEYERVRKGDEGTVVEFMTDGTDRAHVQFARNRLIMAPSQFEKKQKEDSEAPVELNNAIWKSKGSQGASQAALSDAGVRVFGTIKPSKDYYGAQVCDTLSKEPSFTSKLLEARLQGVPGIFAACTGPVTVDTLKIGYVRSAKGKRIRAGMCASLDSLVSRSETCSRALGKELSLHLWRLAAKHTHSRNRQVCRLHDDFVCLRLSGYLHLCFYKWFHLCDSVRMKNRSEAEKQHIREVMDGDLCAMQEKARQLAAEKDRRMEITRNGIDFMVRQWSVGTDKGLISEVFLLWSEFTKKEVTHRRYKGSVEMHVHKWIEGDREGIRHCAMVYWHRYVNSRVTFRRNKATVMIAVNMWMLNFRDALLLSAFKQWDAHRNYAKIHGWHAKQASLDQQKMQQLIGDVKKQHEDDRTKERTNTHAAFDYAFKSWTDGTAKAILWQVFGAWRQRAKHLAQHQRARQAVHSALLRTMEADCRAGVQLCFANWACEMREAHHQKSKSKEVGETKTHLERLLAESKQKVQDLEWKLQSVERRADRFHHSSEHMLKKWIYHELHDLVAKAFSQWKHIAYKEVKTKEEHHAARILKAQHKASRLHLLKFFNLWDSPEVLRVHLASIMTFWHSMSRSQSAIRRQEKLEETLQEAHQAHELAIRRHKQTKEFVIGALGAKSDLSLKLLYMTTWGAYVVQGATKAKLEKEIDNALHRACLAISTLVQKNVQVTTMKEWHRLVVHIKQDRLNAAQLASRQREYEKHELQESHCLRLWNSDSRDFLRGDAFRTWYWYVLHSKQEKEMDSVRGQAEHMRRLHAGPVRRKLFLLFETNGQALVEAVYYVWKELYTDLKFSHHLHKQQMGYKARHVAMGYMAVGTLVRNALGLQVHCLMRAWLHFVAQEIQTREKVMRLRLQGKGKITQDFLTMIVMEKVGVVMTCMAFNAWRRDLASHQDLERTIALNSKVNVYRLKRQRDVGRMMLICIAECDHVRLQIAFAAFFRSVVDARQLDNAEKMWKLLQKSERYRLKHKADVAKMCVLKIEEHVSNRLHVLFVAFSRVIIDIKEMKRVKLEKMRDDIASQCVMAKVLESDMHVFLVLIFHLWHRYGRHEKDMRATLSLSSKADMYRRDVGHMMSTASRDRDETRLHVGFRAFLKATSEARETRLLAQSLHTKNRSREVEDLVSAVVLSKALDDNLSYWIPFVLYAWSKLAEATKNLQTQLQLSAKADKYRTKHQRGVAKMLLISIFDSDCLRLYVAFTAFLKGVAEAREVHGVERVAEMKSLCRSRALPLKEKLVAANEAKDRTHTLMSWKLKLTDDQKETHRSQSRDLSRKYEESLSERQDFAAKAESIKERLGMQLLISERHSDDAVDDSDLLKACTGELWNEAHRQGLLIDSLEHEMRLLEAQYLGTSNLKA